MQTQNPFTSAADQQSLDNALLQLQRLLKYILPDDSNPELRKTTPNITLSITTPDKDICIYTLAALPARPGQPIGAHALWLQNINPTRLLVGNDAQNKRTAALLSAQILRDLEHGPQPEKEKPETAPTRQKLNIYI